MALGSGCERVIYIQIEESLLISFSLVEIHGNLSNELIRIAYPG